MKRLNRVTVGSVGGISWVVKKDSKRPCFGNSLAVQWLRLKAFTAGGLGAGFSPLWGN